MTGNTISKKSGTSSTGGGGGGGGSSRTGTFTPSVSQASGATSGTMCSATTFTRTLSLGSNSEDVKTLQKFLNANGFTIASSGPGSSGNESTYYGPATQAAVKKFQAAYRIDILVPAKLLNPDGNFGTLTMKKANALGGATTCVTTSATVGIYSLGGAGVGFSRDLTIGSTGEDVRRLQQYLNANGYTIAASGTGSKGLESTYFGPATQAALKRFQIAQGVTPVTGYFGPFTRGKIK